MKGYFVVYYLLIFCPFIYSQPPALKSLLIYSSENVILTNEMHAFNFDLKCFASLKGDFVVDLDLPDFDSPNTGSYIFVSKGPATGKYAPYPDPDDPSTYQWSTLNGTNDPIVGFTIKNAGGQTYYAIIDCPNGIDCTYTLVTEYVPSVSKNSAIEAPRNTINFARSPRENNNQLKSVIQQKLYFTHEMELNGTVNYHKWVQYQVPVCASALIPQFNSTLCLLFSVVGQAPDFIFYQQVSLDPTPKQNVVKWKTRNPDSNPYLDYSGKTFLPVNRWMSTPVLPKDMPLFLYHSIVGEGGMASSKPHQNRFVSFYEFFPCNN